MHQSRTSYCHLGSNAGTTCEYIGADLCEVQFSFVWCEPFEITSSNSLTIRSGLVNFFVASFHFDNIKLIHAESLASFNFQNVVEIERRDLIESGSHCKCFHRNFKFNGIRRVYLNSDAACSYSNSMRRLFHEL